MMPAATHNAKVVGSNSTPATMDDEGLADAGAANPFVYPDFTLELVPASSGSPGHGMPNVAPHWG